MAFFEERRLETKQIQTERRRSLNAWLLYLGIASMETRQVTFSQIFHNHYRNDYRAGS